MEEYEEEWSDSPRPLHVSSLRKYHGDGPYQPPAIPKVEDSELFFEVDHISVTRGVPGCQYLVHWTSGGYGWHDAMLLHGFNHHIRGPGSPELSNSDLDMASKLFTFTFTLHPRILVV